MTAAEVIVSPTDLYLDLLAGALTRALFEENDEIAGRPIDWREPSWKQRLGNRLGPLLGRAGYELVRKRPYDERARTEGRDWPARAETMAGLKRLQNARDCIESVITDRVPGDIIETGVWRGGASIYMRGVLKAHGDPRTVWVADSFAGLPPSDVSRYPLDDEVSFDQWDILAVSEAEVRDNFRRYGLLDNQVRFLPGLFKDTLPAAPIGQLSVMRLDGDLYESTIQALEALHPKLMPGGFCIIDDYGVLNPCQRAVHDYRKAHGVTAQIVDIDGTGAYWRLPFV